MKQKILIVDDEEILGRILVKYLKNEGYNAKYINSAKNAIDTDVGVYDLVLTDWAMPDMSGKEFCKLLNKFWPELPVIVVTGSDVKNKEKNIKRIIDKPFGMDTVLSVIREILG